MRVRDYEASQVRRRNQKAALNKTSNDVPSVAADDQVGIAAAVSGTTSNVVVDARVGGLMLPR
jgi:hypothetical protein